MIAIMFLFIIAALLTTYGELKENSSLLKKVNKDERGKIINEFKGLCLGAVTLITMVGLSQDWTGREGAYFLILGFLYLILAVSLRETIKSAAKRKGIKTAK